MAQVRIRDYLCVFLSLVLLLWRTHASEECILEYESYKYNLSSLAAKDFWVFEETTRYADFDLLFYLSVCHPLRNIPTGEHCTNGSAAICVEKLSKNKTLSHKDRFMEVVAPNGGLIKKGSLTFNHNGWLEYKYDNGMACDFHGKKVNFTTSLNLLCPTGGSVETSGPVLMSFMQCQFAFAWLTNTACPIEKDTIKPTTCIDKFHNSSHTLNLHALHLNAFYNVSSSKKYQVNICGPIIGGDCQDKNATVCDVSNPKAPKVISRDSDMDVMWHGDLFTLHYNLGKSGINGEKEVVFNFLCDRLSHDTLIQYVSSNSTHTIFNAKTNVVCTPAQQECVIKDRKGNVFDLRPLRDPINNWEVLDSRDGNLDVLYHINICGHLNEVGYYTCPSGDVGACQTSMNKQTAYNLGFLTSDPIVNDDGSLSVVYTGGDPCHDKKHARSTRIMLICDEIDHEPVFLEETSTCEFVFVWKTTSACPRHVVSSDTCVISDPLFGHTFDLTPMRNAMRDYKTNDGTHTYFINMCGPLVGDQYFGVPPQSAIAAVKNTDSNYYSGGLNPAKLIFNDGILMMEFNNGSKCDDGQNYTSQVLLMCDHDKKDISSGLSVFRDHSRCKLNFLWQTEHACPPARTVDCSITTRDGLKYDLSPLSMSNMNQEEHPPNESVKYVLNVCRSVVHSKNARCPYNSAACRVDLSAKNQSISLGRVHLGPMVEKGILKIKYPMGQPCNSTHSYNTEIVFECDPKDSFPYPVLVEKQECHFTFEWRTSHACPIKVETEPIYGNCTAKNQFSNYLYDLSSLKKPEGYTVSNGEVTLKLNVCGNMGVQCHSVSDGSCLQDASGSSISAGIANADLQYIVAGLKLKYTGGSKCVNGIERTTLISFFCGAENAREGPVLAAFDETSCTYFVNWHTELACDFRIACVSRSYDKTIDLSPFIRHSNNYEIAMPNSTDKFYINVCRPLNHIKDIHCEVGSAACLVRADDSPTSSVSLGKPIIRPSSSTGNTVMLLYSLGGECQTMPGIKYTTKIYFECNRTAGMGYPEFSTITHDCQYQFAWQTSLVCPVEAPTPDSACAIRHNWAKTNIHLNVLYRPEGYRIPFADKVFHINVCGSSQDCKNNASSCTETGVSYGQSHMSQIRWLGHSLQLLYFGGEACDTAVSGKRTTTIYFTCDMEAGYGTPQPDPLMNSLECMALFNWRTNLTCLEAIYEVTTTTTSSVTTTRTTTTTTPGSSVSTTPSTTVAPGNSSGVLPVPDTHNSTADTSSSHTIIVVCILLLLMVFALATYLWRSGYGQRLINRAKMAGVTTRYSSRQGGMLLNESDI